MADSKITALTALTAADPANDMIPIVDVSDTPPASGNTKRISINNILACSPSATLASATITGDLTVDTSTLYVSSSADKVGIGTTSLSNEKLTVAGNISANAWVGRSNIAVPTGDCSIFRSADNTLGFGIASTTAMTLNATGLGVGVSPSFKGHFYSASGSNGVRLQAGSTTAGDTNRLSFQNASGAADARTGCIEWYDVGAFKGDIRFLKAGGIQIRNSADSPTFNLDDTGNVGIGVASPSTKLDVAGNARVQLAFFTGGTIPGLTNENPFAYRVPGGGLGLGAATETSTTSPIVFYTGQGGVERVRVKGAGQVRFFPLASDPAGAEAGDVYYNSTSNKLKCYNGTTWNDLF